MLRLPAWLILAMLLIVSNTLSARDLVDVAVELRQKEMKPDDWKAFVKKTQRSFEGWSNDNPAGSLKRYLDDRLLEIAPGVLGGNVKALKKFVTWLSLYAEFQEPVPGYVQEVESKYMTDIEEVMKDFTWEKAGERIKRRKAQFDKENPQVEPLERMGGRTEGQR